MISNQSPVVKEIFNCELVTVALVVGGKLAKAKEFSQMV